MRAEEDASFGALLRRSRKAAGLTQEELSDRTGLSVRTISGMEGGRTARPYRRSVLLLADALGLSPQDRELLIRLAREPAGQAPPDSPPDSPPARPQPAGAPPVRPAQLPPDIAEFTGRTEQVEWLTGVLGRTGQPGQTGKPVRIAAVTGAGGAGKSALAIHVAHRLSYAFGDGQLFVELQGSGEQPASTSDVLARMLRQLGMADAAIPADPAERSAEFRTRMAELSMLLVFDDVRDAAHVRPLLPGSSASAVLVTSRGVLADLEGSRVLELGALDDQDALALFSAICGPKRVIAERDATQAVLGACGGLPLAIRIAASRLVSRPAWDIASLARRLSDERQRLSELAVGDLAVRASFQVSYANLSAAGDAGRAFRLLGLWPGADISLQAAAALLGLAEDPASVLLERLVDVHMLETSAAHRYRFHDLIRVFAAECAQADEPPASRQEAVGRILLWYLHTADAALIKLSMTNRADLKLVPAGARVTPLAFASHDPAADWCDDERDNMVSAVALAHRGGAPEICAQLAEVAFRWIQRSSWDGWSGVLEQGIDCAQALGDVVAEAWLHSFVGITENLHGRFPEAIEHLDRAVALSQATGNKSCEANAIGNLAIAYKELKRFDEAIASLKQVLVIDPELARPGVVLVNLGLVYIEAGRLEEGTDWLEEGLELLSARSDLRGESMGRSMLADAYRQLGRRDDAIRSAERALEISRLVHDEYYEAAAWAMMGQILADSGQTEWARSSLDKALRLAERLGVPESEQIAASLAALDAIDPPEQC